MVKLKREPMRILLVGFLILVCFLFLHQQHQKAPSKTIIFLESKGYKDIQITQTMFVFGLDLCSRDVIKVAFKASLQGKVVSGYVCLEPLLPYSIHQD